MKKIIITFFASIITLLSFGQANTYFHDRIDTTLFAIADTVGHGANHYYATNLTPDFNVKQYINGCTVNLFFKKGNTGSATLTLVTKTATLSSKTIRKANGQVLLSGDIPDSTAVILDYYNGSFRIAGIGVTASSSSWLLTGNGGTTAGTNFLGTTDAQDIVFKRNSTELGRFSSSGFNLGLASTNNGALIFKNSTNANTLTINSGITSASHSWTLPTAQGAASTFLQNDGAGALSWNNGLGSFWGLTGNSGTNSATNFLGTTDAQDVVFKRNSSEVMRLYSSSNFVGIGTATPTARLDIVTTNSAIATYCIGIKNPTTGRYLFGGDNRGHFGINGNGGTFAGGVIDDGTFEILQCSNMDGQYGLIVKDSTRTHVQFRTNYGTLGAPNVQLGDENASTIYSYGVNGFGVPPNTDYRIYSKGTGNSSATYNIVTTNSDNTNMFHVRNDARVEVHKYLVSNPFGTNALSPTAYTGQVAFNCNTNVPLGSVDDAGGSFNVTCLAASAVNVGPNVTFWANYDSGLYPMGDISGRRENGTAANSAGYLQFSTHTTATDGLTEGMRLTSTQQLGIGTASPSAKIHVVNTLTTQPTFKVVGSNTVTIDYNGIGDIVYPHAQYNNTVTITYTSTTEAKAILFPNRTDSLGFYVVGDSLFYARYSGVYEIIVTSNAGMSAASGGNIDTWININGSIVANSGHSVTVNSALKISYVNQHTIRLNAGDYFKISTHADDTRCQFVYTAAGVTPTRPASPSVELSVFKISKL